MRSAAADVKGLGRIVRGRLSSSGGVVSGSGFRCTNPSTGRYDVTFDVPFKSKPHLELTHAAGGYSSEEAVVDDNTITPNGFTFYIFSTSAATLQSSGSTFVTATESDLA